MITSTDNGKRFAYFVIADDDGVRRVPVGLISERSTVISIEYDDAPAPIAPAPITQQRTSARSIGILMLLIAAACYSFGGVWAVVTFLSICALAGLCRKRA